MQIVSVELGARSYPIYIGPGLLTESNLLQKHLVSQQVLIVSSEPIANYYLATLQKSFSQYQCDVVLLPDGEQYKSLETLNKIFDALLTHRHRRNTTLVALGGGVVCDMTGFAAACYQRGVGFIQIPTTLLAQVDASIGGKTAVNHPLAKNMIGAFHQPRAVIIDTDTLNSLPEREYRAGIAEIIKAALIRDAAFFTWLEEHLAELLQKNPQALTHAIARACAIKAEIVAADETEITGVRALLNLGHTFGHALEQTLGYGTWLHGEAVAAGMILAADLSQRLGWLEPADFIRIKTLIQRSGLPTQLPVGVQCDKILNIMAVDKKNISEQLRLVLLRKVGKGELTDTASISQVRQVLADYIK